MTDATQIERDFGEGVTLFRCIAVTTAAENKALRSTKLKVYNHEKMSMADGELADRTDTVEYKGVDAQGQAVQGTGFMGQTYEAEWLPTGNRKTAPDVRRGERIELWQYADNDKYYWRCLNLDEHLRRLETIVIGINANPTETQDGLNPEDMYFMEFSSHTKMITLSTSKKNGEFCTYDLQLNMAEGRVVLQDDLNNQALFDSKETNIHWHNALGAMLELNKKDINAFAPNNIKAEATNNVNIKAGVEAILQGGGSILTLNSGGTTLKTPDFKGIS